jgi:hypothetical protein
MAEEKTEEELNTMTTQLHPWAWRPWIAFARQGRGLTMSMCMHSQNLRQIDSAV